jgi:hypothetical protein
MDVVRATTATRVNSAGLIEVVPRNLITYSNDISNAAWVKVSGSGGTTPIVTSNYAISPSGLTDATIVQLARTTASGSFSVIRQAITILPNTNYRQSVWLKSLSGTPSILIADNGGSFINLVTLTTEWIRYDLPFTNTFNFCNFDFALSQSIAGSSLTADFLVYGAQLDQGPTATEYFPTTTRLNIPRIDYTNGSCPSLLVEPQRTNVLTYSNDLNGVNWAAINTTKTSGQVSPTPSNNEGWLLNKTATGVDGTIYNAFSIPSLSTYTYSWYILKDNNESRFPEFYLRLNSGQVEQYVQINTKTGNLGVRVAAAGCTQSISLSPNGLWWRLTLTNPTPIANLGDNRHGLRPAAGTTLGVININATGSVIVYGAQTEAGSYPTSYIPTVASSVTRNADVISKTGISSLIGQTEGTIFFDGIVNNIQNGTSNILNTNKNPSTISSIALTKIKATNKIRFEQFLGDGTFVNIPLLSTNSFLDGIRTKVAIRYKSGDFAMYINGNLEATSTSTYTNIGVKSELFLNDSVAIFAFQESVSFNSAQLYKTPLTNLELKSLSTI